MRPPLACRNCRNQRRKCDRAYPICSNCRKTYVRCSYHSSFPQNQQIGMVPFPSVYIGHASGPAISAAAMFLDYRLFQEKLRNVDTALQVSSELQEFVNQKVDQRQYITTFNEVFDSWLPIIPKRNLQTWSCVPMSQLTGEELLLVACIKTLTQPPTEERPVSKEYLSIKSTLIGVESSGIITLSILQALFLVLLYEFGHGIYPSAHVTLGTCIRYLLALGIDEFAVNSHMQDTWIQGETQLRLWWAIFMMERCMGLGSPERKFLIKEPSKSTLLPSDDMSWEQEYPSVEPRLTLESPALSEMGNFRLLAHSTYLISQVITYVSDHSSQSPEGTTQLYRTVSALINVVEAEREGNSTCFVPRALLNTAIFIVYPNSSLNSVDVRDNSGRLDPCLLPASYFLQRARAFLSSDLAKADTINPFIIHWGYQAFRYYYTKYQQERHLEHQHALEDLQQTFQRLNKRWKLAGVYASFINIHQSVSDL
ncbi:hypothetical protein V8C35DRAFT_318304 [Trichoderma chlorosporum]